MKVYCSRMALSSLLVLLFLLAGCPATQVVFPPISTQTPKVETPGKFVWFDLFSDNPTQSEAFYDSLFGWDFKLTENSQTRVKTIFLDDTPIGNVIKRESTSKDSQWLSYMSTEDVNTSLDTATLNGGAIYRESEYLPDRGDVGVIIDPQGAAFAVLSSLNGDPADGKPKSNMWIGAELWTKDVAAAAKFYQAIGGYDAKVVGLHEKVEYLTLRKEGKLRAGVVSIPWKKMNPEWVPYIAVEDVPAIVAKAKALGGKILVAPDMAVKEGRLAMIADPYGALFGIFQIQ